MNSKNDQEISKLKKEISSLKSSIKENEDMNKVKIMNFEENLNTRDETIKKLNSENQTLKESLLKWHTYYKNQITKLEESLNIKDKEIQKLKKERNNIEKNYQTLSQNYSMQQNQIIEYENKIIKSRKLINILKISNRQRKNDYEKLNAYFLNLQYEKNELNKQNIILNNELNKIKANADKSKKYENKNKEDFYDLIIKCNSIIGLQNGWEISMTEKGRRNYKEHKNIKYTKIGVIGSENRGKSTILSDFSQIELPTGASIKTEGLSIKYPELKEFKNRKFILLDSAGLETPILKREDEIESEEKIGIKKIENGIGEIIIEDKNESVNDLFENKSRDIIQLELFLQNFIIKYSDVLILILGKLTINEQKLLLKVNTHIKNLNRKEPLIVIHNLKEFETKKQVEDYLKDILKKSSTFSLEENLDINLDNEESGWRPFFEPKSDPKIFHLIYAKKGTEAGDYYNNKTINYIYKLINLFTDKECFDPIECIKNYFSEISETILENPIKKQDLIYNDNDILNLNGGKKKDNEVNKLLLKDTKKHIILKKCLIDELGIIQKNSVNIQYSYYITDKNVFVYIELPGKCSEPNKDIEYENVEIEPEFEGSYYIIKIKGKKKNRFEKIIKAKKAIQLNKRQFGEFDIKIKLDKINLIDKYEHKIENGCLLITFFRKKGICLKQI